jgi:putative aldouronate transport system substrate-binding protein
MEAPGHTLTWWTEQYGLNGFFSTAGESPFHAGLARQLGVAIDWRFPEEGTGLLAAASFQKMLSEGALPDIVAHGGIMEAAERYIDEGVIWDLSPYLEKWSPNYWRFLRSNPVYDRSMKTDSGRYYGYGFFREDGGWNDTYIGPVIRKDWLDECALPMPQTVSDWQKTLRAFKARYGAVFASTGWRFEPTGISGAFGAYTAVAFKLYIDDDGIVRCANNTPEYKNYLSTLHAWYAEGLIDPGIFSASDVSVEAEVKNDHVGLAIGALSQLATWRSAAQKTGSKAEWVGAPYPKGDDGTLSMIYGGYGVGAFVAAISKNCPEDKLELAMRALDYGYSPEGILYWNYGERGKAWDFNEKGLPEYLPLVTDDPMGMVAATSKHGGTYGYSNAVQATRFLHMRLDPQTIAANDLWYYPNKDVAASSCIPPGLTYTPEEAKRRNALLTPMASYAADQAIKFITGEEPISAFDAFTARLDRMGLEEVLVITRAAYARYLKR